MPRYHFHTDDGRHHPDPDGLELESHEAVRTEAIRAVGQLVDERHQQFWQDGAFRMTVTNEDGLTLIILDLTAIVSPAFPQYR